MSALSCAARRDAKACSVSPGLVQLLVAMAERGAPQPSHAVDIGLARGVVDQDPLPAIEHQRAGLAKPREIGVGMDERLDVTDGLVAERHGVAFGGPAAVWP